MTGQDVQSPSQLPFFQDDRPSASESEDDVASPFCLRSTFRGETVKKGIGWKDIRAEFRDERVDTVVGDPKKQMAQGPCVLAHKNASRGGGHARISDFSDATPTTYLIYQA